MAGHVTVTECPNCGGPIDPGHFRSQSDPLCPFCAHALPLEEDAPSSVPGVTVVTTGATRATRRGARVVVIAVLVSVGVTAAIVVASMTTTSKSKSVARLSVNYRVLGPVVPASSDPGIADIYVVAPTVGAPTTPVLRRVNPVTRKVQWSAPPIRSTNTGKVPLVIPAQTRVVVIADTTVLALDAASGRQLWQASLSNELASPCDGGCAFVTGTHLVSLAKDGTLQSFDLTSGSQSWSKRLNSTPRWLHPAGDLVAVTDVAATSGHDLDLLLVDPGTGAGRSISPGCAKSPFAGTAPARAHEEGAFFVDPDGKAVTVLVTTSGGCAVRYRLPDGAPVWSTASVPDGSPIPFTLTGQATAQGPGIVAWTNNVTASKDVYVIDQATGLVRRLFDAGASTVTLEGVANGALVMQIAPNFDSSKPLVVAVDLASGQVRWRLASRAVASGDKQKVYMIAANVLVVSCQDEAETCRFESVDPDTGTIKGSTTVKAGLIPTVESLTAGPGSALANVNNERVVAIDASTAAVRASWPG